MRHTDATPSRRDQRNRGTLNAGLVGSSFRPAYSVNTNKYVRKKSVLCLLKYVKNTAHDCQYKLCRVCGKKQLKNAPHECLARWEPCPTCHQPYLLAKPEKHQCQKQCYLCKKYFLLTEYDGHACLKTYCNICKRNHPADAVCIPRKHCRHCQKTFLKSEFDSHDCTKTRCRKCGGHFPWSEIADHTCVEVKQCSHCNRTFPVSEWEDHRCPSRRCAKCGWVFPRSDFDNHECDRQRCFACLAYRKFEEMEAHWLECPGLEKRAQGLCYYTTGCQEPRLPTFRHCAKHKGKLNDTIIDSFTLLITLKLYVRTSNSKAGCSGRFYIWHGRMQPTKVD